MHIIIRTPMELRTVQATWVELNTPHGNFVVQKGHAPMIVTLAKNQPFVLGLSDDTHQTLIATNGGVVHISRGGATILVDCYATVNNT